MSSIMTNTAAMTALQTLQMTQKNLDETQNQISTGYKVASASDNAAYWSIATTMRSDNKALSTVQDALGLGASTIDTAYTGMNAAKDAIDQIKSDLVAATAPGVDKTKIQSDISQYQQQLQSIASSASFSGSNWLSVNTDSSDYNSSQQIVASFNRTSSGAINIGTINVDIAGVSLFDSGAAKSGLLDAGSGNTSTASIADATASGSAGGPVSAGSETSANVIDYTGTTATDKMNFDVSVDNGPAVNVDVAYGASLDDLVTNLNGTGAGQLGAGATASNVDGKLVITSASTGASSSVAISNVSYTDSAGSGTAAADLNFDATGDTVTPGADASTASAATLTSGTAFASAVTLDKDDTITFSIGVDGGNAKAVTLSKATVDKALGTTDGVIGTSADMQKVVALGLTDAGVSGVTVGVGTGADADKLTFTSGTTGADSSVTVSGTTASDGNAFSIMDVDVTNASVDQINSYINGVSAMFDKVTAAAADLGSYQSRVSTQTDFVKSLMDTIDTGVGTLVDADMSEESTKLQALQTQQQLGIQALSIANSNSQSILSLFR